MVRYQVVVKAKTEPLRERFFQWMQTEHMTDMLAIDGCNECRIYADGTLILICEYQFLNKDKLQHYLSNGAKIMRAKAEKHFRSDDLMIERSQQKRLV